MEFEIADNPREQDEVRSSSLVSDRSALKNQSPGSPEDYPEEDDRALHIPEEEKD